MNLHTYQLYLLEQHRESFKNWSAIIRINTEGKSLIMKSNPVLIETYYLKHISKTYKRLKHYNGFNIELITEF